jgi:hypothetical protein
MSVAIKPMTRPIAKADHHRTIFIRRKMMKAGTARTAVKVTAPKYHANIVAKVENSCSLNVPLSMGVTMMTIKAVTRGAKTKAVTSLFVIPERCLGIASGEASVLLVDWLTESAAAP